MQYFVVLSNWIDLDIFIFLYFHIKKLTQILTLVFFKNCAYKSQNIFTEDLTSPLNYKTYMLF